MADLIVESLVGLGELTLILLGSALLVGLGYMIEQAIFGKSCDKK